MREYALTDLAEATGLSPRTIRYYIAQGLVPAPGRQGSATRYPRSTLDRLHLIARLRDANVPLASIRQRLGQLGDEDVAMSVGALSVWADRAPATPVFNRAIAPHWLTEELDYPFFGPGTHLRPRTGRPDGLEPSADLHTVDVAPRLANEHLPEPGLGQRSQWERITISRDVELHVRRPLSPHDNRLVSRLVELAGRMVEATP